MPKEQPPIPDRSSLGPYGDEEPVRERASDAVQSEPVAYLYENEEGSRELVFNANGEHARRLIEFGYCETRLYAHPSITVMRPTPDHSALLREMVEALEPFANAAAGVQAFDPDFPMEGAALRASFDWYDKIQSEPLKRRSVRRSDLENARAALRKAREVLG